jgi:hypothetical protein
LMIRDINPSNTSHSQSPKRKTKYYNMPIQIWIGPIPNYSMSPD